jgi:branched-chain amino acid transport system substrate-binding protein
VAGYFRVQEEDEELSGEKDTDRAGSAVSRREFLKIAGIAGATIGAGAGLGGLLAACGGTEETTTTTAAATTTTAGGTSTTAGASSTTTVSAGVEAGRPIKLGWSTPQTGSLAGFGGPNRYTKDRLLDVWKNGIVCGDGKNHPIQLSFIDNQSDSNRASQVAADLILNEKVDIVLANSSPDLLNPVADQCETLGVPGILVDCPWQPWYFRATPPADGWKWSVLMFWGLEDVIATFTSMWDQNPTNKTVGGLWPNDPDGNAWRDGFNKALTPMGYTIVDPGAFPVGMEDYTTIIGDFKKGGVEIVSGVLIPPDFANFMKQAAQQGLKMKYVSVGKGLLFPASMAAMGDVGLGATTENWWHRKFPFKSSLTGETCDQMAADYEAKTGEQWCSPLMHYILGEVTTDVLKRTKDIESKDAIMKAVFGTKLDTLNGTIDFTAPVAEGSKRPVPNVSKTPLAGGQWRKGTKWPYELVIVGNVNAPMVAVEDKAQPLS